MLIAQVYAAEAVFASLAVIAPQAVSAIQAVAAKIAVVVFSAVNAFITKRAFFNKRIINAVLRKPDPEVIETVFSVIVADQHIGIFGIRMIRAVISVFTAHRQNARMGPRFSEPLKAFEEIHAWNYSR